jgi:chromosome segregation ATPase
MGMTMTEKINNKFNKEPAPPLPSSIKKWLDSLPSDFHQARAEVVASSTETFLDGHETILQYLRPDSSTSDNSFASIYDNLDRRNDYSSLMPKEIIFSEELKTIKSSLAQISAQIKEFSPSIFQFGAAREGDHQMSQEMLGKLSAIEVQLARAEGKIDNLTDKFNTVDKKVDDKIAVLNDKIDMRFGTIQENLSEIKAAIKGLATKDFTNNAITISGNSIDKNIASMKHDVDVIKKKTDDAVTNKKWLTTTIIASIAALAAIAKIIIG